jgi:hypothetical protein
MSVNKSPATQLGEETLGELLHTTGGADRIEEIQADDG